VHKSELLGLKRDFLNVLQHKDDAKFTFMQRARKKLAAWRRPWWMWTRRRYHTLVDGPDGLMLQEQFGEVGQSGPSTMMMKYSEWKSFDGLEYPTSMKCSAAIRQAEA